MKVMPCSVQKPVSAPEYSMNLASIKLREGVYATRDSDARFIVIKHAASGATAVLYYYAPSNKLEPANEGAWGDKIFKKLEGVEVCFELRAPCA
jgi:hypothetical protein